MSGSDHQAGPDRAIRALWGQPSIPQRGPERALSVTEVVDKAIELANDHGLDAVSMRRLASVLGITPMALYTYVPDKAVLIDMMLDRSYEALVGGPTPRPRSLRRALEQIVRSNYAFYRARPWAASVATVRPRLGPGALARYERELRMVDGYGLDDLAMDDVVTLTSTFSQAAARNAAAAATALADSGMTDAEWWAVAGPALAEVTDARTYPLASRVGSAAGQARKSAHDPDHAFEFGLARLLDGVMAMLKPTLPRSSKGR